MEDELRVAELDLNFKLLIRSGSKHISSLTYVKKKIELSTKAPPISAEAFVHNLGDDVKSISDLLTKLLHPLEKGNSDEYWSLLSHGDLFNRLMTTKSCKIFEDIALVNPKLWVTIPVPYQRSHHEKQDSIKILTEDLPDREKYSSPIIHDHKYAYYKDYDGEEHIVPNLTEAEKKKIINKEIAKNKADAQSIFLYTQVKRARRVLGNPEDNYFSKGEKSEDIYDVERRNRGPACCYSSVKPMITTIGHATLLLQFPEEGINVLTDPVFHDMQTVLYPRKTEPAWMENQMPLIDVVIISHNHRDHVDEPSLKALVCHQPIVLVPLGDAHLMKKLGFTTVIEHNTWQRTKLTVNKMEGERKEISLSFISVPANHWSCRGLNDANKSLFLGWVIAPSSQQESIYFAGDTAVLSEKDQTDILMNTNYGPVSLNLVPGGPNHERDTMENTHASAAHGIYSHFFHLDLRAKIPHPSGFDKEFYDDYQQNIDYLLESKFCCTMFMHHNTFELGIDRFNEAEYVREALIKAIEIDNHSEQKFGFVNQIAKKISTWENTKEVINSVVNPKIGEIFEIFG